MRNIVGVHILEITTRVIHRNRPFLNFCRGGRMCVVGIHIIMTSTEVATPVPFQVIHVLELAFIPSFLPSVSLTVAFFISFISYLDSCFHLVHFLFLHVLPCGQISNLYLLSQRCPQFPTIPSKGKCGRRTKRPKIYRHNEAGAQA